MELSGLGEVFKACPQNRRNSTGEQTLLPYRTKLGCQVDPNKFAQRIARVGSTVAELLDGYRALATLVRATTIAPISRDPDDDQVLACALAANAHLIVTRDQDLLALNPFHTTRILSARAALAFIAEQKG